jgi:hypothetical protein
MTMTVTSTPLRTVVDCDGAAILDSKRGLITTLNATGAFVWQGLERGEWVSAIVENLVRETGEDPTAVELDVLEFIESLKEQHLIAR